MTKNLSTAYDQFLLQFPQKPYPKGSVLIPPCAKLTDVIFLRSGTISKYTITKYGEKVIMNVFTAPVLLPLSWVLNKSPNRYYFEAQTAVEVRWIPANELSSYLKTDPETTYHLLQQVYVGLENTQQRIAYLMRGSLKSRLLFELAIEARRAGTVRDDGGYVITIGEIELAERAGVSRETISRELAKLFKSGDLFARQGRSIVIRNLQELDELLRKIT